MTTANAASKTSPKKRIRAASNFIALIATLLICQIFTKNRCHVFSPSINVKLGSFPW